MATVGQWTHGLFGCFDDCGTCLCAYCCTPCLFHSNAGRVGVPCGCCIWYIPFLNWFCQASVRGKVRQRRNIPGDLLTDCLVHCCCHCCALAQETQELDFADRSPNMGATMVVINTTQVPSAVMAQPQNPPANAYAYDQQQGYPAYPYSGQPQPYPGQPQPYPYAQPTYKAGEQQMARQ